MVKKIFFKVSMVYQCQDDAETGILKKKVHKNHVTFQNFILLIIICFLKLLKLKGQIITPPIHY